MPMVNANPAPIFRRLAAGPRTLLVDEVDAIFGGRSTSSDDPRADLRALLNEGHRRGATVDRCVGPKQEVVEFPVFAACALAGLGDLPDTLMSRSVIVRDETPRTVGTGSSLSGCACMVRPVPSWPGGSRVGPTPYASTWQASGRICPPGSSTGRPTYGSRCSPSPTRPGGAGPTPPAPPASSWPRSPRPARRVSASGCSQTLRDVFGDSGRLSSETILEALHAVDEAPWADLHGKALDARGMARRLRQYEVTPLKVKVDGKALKGYRREDLWDAWSRYLVPLPPQGELGEPGEPHAQDAAAEVPFEVPFQLRPSRARGTRNHST